MVSNPEELADSVEWHDIAARLRNERDKKGLKQIHVAKRMGVTQGYVGKIERGEQVPPADTLFAFITKGIGMSLGTFFAPWLEADSDVERYAKRTVVAALRDSRHDLALDLINSLKRKGHAPRSI